MEVRRITRDGVEQHEPDQLEHLVNGAGLLWIDVAHWDAVAEDKLVRLLGLHPRAVHDCAVRNPVPKVHVYPGQVFVVLHAS